MMPTPTHRLTALSIPGLHDSIHGRVIAPDDPDYDPARAVTLGGIDARPAVIVRVADTADVQRVIGVAGDTGLELAIRSGGHSAAGHSTTIGGIVLDLRDLASIDIDAANRTAWVGSGATTGMVTAAAAAQGLAIGFGDTGSVGVGGITLGGGVGYLVRRFGLTIDSLLGAEIVTADGMVRTIDAQHEPDLFWAIRGGGGNFGVVTRFRFQLHPLERVVGGMLILPARADTIAGFMAAAEAAPDELSGIANVMPCPPMPFVPADVHGQLVIFAVLVDAGDVANGDRVMAPFRALATPLADMLREMPYPDIFPPADPDYHPTAVARTMFLDHVDMDVAQTIMDRLQASDAPMRAAQLRVLGGAMARVPADATAFAHRSCRIMANIATFYDGPEDLPTREAWVTGTVDALRQGDDGAYVNFLADEGPERVHAAYPGPTWDRLTAIKARYDPDDLFRRNHNIPPAG